MNDSFVYYDAIDGHHYIVPVSMVLKIGKSRSGECFIVTKALTKDFEFSRDEITVESYARIYQTFVGASR